MRITNNMMLRNTTANINGNKLNVNTLNNQMSSQKKISRPSENPVVAIRALRYRSSLSEINQYYENNIPDAESWLNTTETALKNMQEILKDIRTQCTYGATDTLKTEDRSAILEQLNKLRQQVYAEGNADYAGRTVFTGYRTNSNLTFDTDEDNTTYEINQSIAYTSIDEHRYYSGQITLGTADQMIAGVNEDTSDDATAATLTNPTEEIHDRIRVAYGGTEALTAVSYTPKGSTVANTITVTNTYDTVEEWLNDTSYTMDDTNTEAVYIKDTGELILSDKLSSDMKAAKATINVTYDKTGFDKGEVRPEYYFNCTDKTEPTDQISYQKYDASGNEIEQNIDYIVAMNQTLTVNTNASKVFDSSIGRDVDEMLNAVQDAILAHDKLSQIETMMSQEAYSDKDSQAYLQQWKDAAKKECDYADDNLQKMYSSYIGNFDEYMTKVNLALTTIGSKGDSLALTETRMSNQQLTIEELKSTNEDRELSDIIIDYTAAYTAYEASLQAAGKINSTSLLNYI